jgi:hypothetical protein
MQTCIADLKAGDWTLIVDGTWTPRMLICGPEPADPDDPPGSGKWLSPCARMHLENASPALSLDPVVDVPPPMPEPHAVSARHVTVAASDPISRALTTDVLRGCG